MERRRAANKHVALKITRFTAVLIGLTQAFNLILSKEPWKLRLCSESTLTSENVFSSFGIYIIYFAQTPEIEQGLGRFLSCGARKQEQT